jgi:hypothetical protein
MNALDQFFKGSDTRFGIFYPKDYLLAAFPSFSEATQAERELLGGGFAEEDVMAVPGEEVVRHAEDHLKKQGLWTLLMNELSRLIGTEAEYADHDLELARKGAGFVAVYCPTHELKRKAWRLLEHRSPIVARHYALTGIEHLTGEA